MARYTRIISFPQDELTMTEIPKKWIRPPELRVPSKGTTVSSKPRKTMEEGRQKGVHTVDALSGAERLAAEARAFVENKGRTDGRQSHG